MYLRGNAGVSASTPSEPLGKVEQAQIEQELEADANKEEQLYSEVQVGLQSHHQMASYMQPPEMPGV